MVDQDLGVHALVAVGHRRGILLVGYAGVHPSVGQGYEFQAITAVVLGGVVLGGGRGWVLSAAAGAFALELLLALLTFRDVESTWRNTVQGIIIILAVAASARAWTLGRRPPSPSGDPLNRHRNRGGPHCPATIPAGHRHRRTLMRRKSIRGPLAVTAALLLAVLTACSQTSEPNAGDDPTDTATSEATAEETEDAGDDTEWFDQAVFDEQDEQRGGDVRG